MKTIEVNNVIKFLEAEQEKYREAKCVKEAMTIAYVINSFKKAMQDPITIGDLTRRQIQEHRKIEANTLEVEFVNTLIAEPLSGYLDLNSEFCLDTPIKDLYKAERLYFGDFDSEFQNMLEIEVDKDYE